MCRCQKQFGFENPEQMQLNSLVNHKKKEWENVKIALCGFQKIFDPPRDIFVTLLPPLPTRELWMISKELKIYS